MPICSDTAPAAPDSVAASLMLKRSLMNAAPMPSASASRISSISSRGTQAHQPRCRSRAHSWAPRSLSLFSAPYCGRPTPGRTVSYLGPAPAPKRDRARFAAAGRQPTRGAVLNRFDDYPIHRRLSPSRTPPRPIRTSTTGRGSTGTPTMPASTSAGHGGLSPPPDSRLPLQRHLGRRPAALLLRVAPRSGRTHRSEGRAVFAWR